MTTNLCAVAVGALEFEVSRIDTETPALPIPSPIKAPKSGDCIKAAVVADERQGMLPAESANTVPVAQPLLAVCLLRNAA